MIGKPRSARSMTSGCWRSNHRAFRSNGWYSLNATVALPCAKTRHSNGTARPQQTTDLCFMQWFPQDGGVGQDTDDDGSIRLTRSSRWQIHPIDPHPLIVQNRRHRRSTLCALVALLLHIRFPGGSRCPLQIKALTIHANALRWRKSRARLY